MLKHTKNGNYYETLDDAISEELTEIDTGTQYDEMLDCNGDIYCGFGSYSPSYIMQRLDLTMYNCGYNDYTSELYEHKNGKYYENSEVEELENELEEIDPSIEACQYFDFEGMIFDENGDETETMEQVTQKAINFLFCKNYV